MRAFAFILLIVSAVVVAAQENNHVEHHNEDQHLIQKYSYNDLDERGPVYDALKATIDDSYHYHKVASQELNAKINRTQHLMKMHLEMLKESNQVKNKIEAIKMQGEYVIPCLYKFEDEITDIADKWVSKFDLCTANVQKNIELIAEEIFDVVNVIHTAPLKVQQIQKDCIVDDSTGQSVLCVVAKLAELEEKTFAANQSSKMIIGHIVNEFQQFVEDIHSCDGLSELNDEAQNVALKIEECARNQKHQN